MPSYTARVARHVARFGKHLINFVFGEQRLGRWNKKLNAALRYDIGVDDKLDSLPMYDASELNLFLMEEAHGFGLISITGQNSKR